MHIVMELIRGNLLFDLMEQAPRSVMSPLGLRSLLFQIVEALDGLHATGVVHRDLKPTNIILEKDTGLVRLIDFGLAVELSDSGVNHRNPSSAGCKE